jgi:hypothetical protein
MPAKGRCKRLPVDTGESSRSANAHCRAASGAVFVRPSQRRGATAPVFGSNCSVDDLPARSSPRWESGPAERESIIARVAVRMGNGDAWKQRRPAGRANRELKSLLRGDPDRRCRTIPDVNDHSPSKVAGDLGRFTRLRFSDSGHRVPYMEPNEAALLPVQHCCGNQGFTPQTRQREMPSILKFYNVLIPLDSSLRRQVPPVLAASTASPKRTTSPRISGIQRIFRW